VVVVNEVIDDHEKRKKRLWLLKLILKRHMTVSWEFF